MPPNELKQKSEEIEKLVRRAQEGDTEAFADLYEIFVNPIYRYVYYRVHSDDAEDLVETVFLKVWNKLSQYKPQEKTTFSAWIFRIAHNLVVDYYRSHKDRDVEELDPRIPDENSISNPQSETERALNKGTLKSALSRLKKQYKDILVYKFINDLSNKEIAEVLDKSEGSLRILQHRALKALKKELDDMGINY